VGDSEAQTTACKVRTEGVRNGDDDMAREGEVGSTMVWSGRC
jgi:hypothetical protein